MIIISLDKREHEKSVDACLIIVVDSCFNFDVNLIKKKVYFLLFKN